MTLARCDLDGKIAVITMTNQSKRNVLSEAMIGELLDGLAQAQAAEARAVILRAEPGSGVWSSGHDVTELPAAHRDPLGWGDPLRKIVRSIEEFPAPVIALIEGGVWGGACEVAMNCDLVVATPESSFALTPAKIGVPYNVTGLLTFMGVMPLHVAKEMLFTAKPFSAQRCAELGMVNHLVNAAEITEFCLALGRHIETLAPMAIAVMKEEMRVLASAHSITPRMFERVQGLRRTVYDSADYQEGVKAFLEKRRPVYTGK